MLRWPRPGGTGLPGSGIPCSPNRTTVEISEMPNRFDTGLVCLFVVNDVGAFLPAPFSLLLAALGGPVPVL